MFTPVDWIVLILYFIATLSLGLFFSRKNDSLSQCLFADGSLPWWAVGISLIATSISATTFLGNPADTYQGNMTYMMLNLGVPVSILITCLVFIPYIRSSQAQSAYEVLEKRFDLKTRTFAAIMYSLHLLLRTGILLYGPALVFSKIVNISIYTSIVLVGVIAISYTILGGIRAVVWTDVIQFFVLAGGAVITIVYCSFGLNGGFSEGLAIAREADKLRWFDASLDLSQARNFWSAGVAYIVLDLALRACDQQFVQRYLSCSSIFKAQKSTILSAVFGALIGWGFFMVGAFLFAYYHVNSAFLPSNITQNEIFPFFIVNNLPIGLSGILVAAIFAASMSSLDSAISALSNTTAVDFLKRFKLVKNEKQELRAVRLSMFFWGVTGVGAGFLAALAGQSLLHIALSFTALFTGPLLGIFILAVFFKKSHGTGAFTGALVGMIILGLVNGAFLKGLSAIGFSSSSITEIIQNFNGIFIEILGKLGLVNQSCVSSGSCHISWPWYPVISCSVTVTSGLILSYVIPSKADSQQKAAPYLK